MLENRPITKITYHDMARLVNHRYITTGTEYAKKYNLEIYKAVFRTLALSKINNNSNEVLLAVNNQTFENIIDYGTDKEVIANTVMQNTLLYSSNKSFTLIHNHPRNNPMSIQDVMTAMCFPSVTATLVVTNNCDKIYYVVKEKSGYAFYLRVRMKLSQYRSTGCNTTEDIKDYLETLSSKGLKYKVFEAKYMKG